MNVLLLGRLVSALRTSPLAAAAALVAAVATVVLALAELLAVVTVEVFAVVVVESLVVAAVVEVPFVVAVLVVVVDVSFVVEGLVWAVLLLAPAVVAAAPLVESLLDDPMLHPVIADAKAQMINPVSNLLAREIISDVNPSTVTASEYAGRIYLTQPVSVSLHRCQITIAIHVDSDDKTPINTAFGVDGGE